MQNRQQHFMRGSVVYTKAGHDAGSFYVVITAQADVVWIADGRRRCLEKPKCKNVKHLQGTKMLISEQQLSTNKQIRRVLWELNFGVGSEKTAFSS